MLLVSGRKNLPSSGWSEEGIKMLCCLWSMIGKLLASGKKMSMFIDQLTKYAVLLLSARGSVLSGVSTEGVCTEGGMY